MDQLLLEYNRLKKEKAELETAFLMYKNVEALPLLQEKDKKLSEQLKYKLELENDMKKVKDELQEKDSKKAKLMLEADLLKLEWINLNNEWDNLKSKKHEKSSVKYEEGTKVERREISKILESEPVKSLVKNTDCKLFSCNICDKMFKNKSYILMHKKKVHCETRIKCKICLKDYKIYEYYLNHFNKSHKEMKGRGKDFMEKFTPRDTMPILERQC